MKKMIQASIIIVAVLAVTLWTIPTWKLQQVKQNAIDHNPSIDKVIEVNRVGGWGEWYSEFVLIVEVDGERKRIWVNGAGEIIDQETLTK